MLNPLKRFLHIEYASNRIYGLDILRALAILMVVYAHGQTLLPAEFSIFFEVIRFDGVTVFFVLSGFLIGRILIRTIESESRDRQSLLNFWKRRWYRTLPNYFLVLIFLTCYTLLTNSNFYFKKSIAYFFFSQNLWFNHPSFFGEAWSLSIEEWFYFLAPLSLFFLIRVFKTKPKTSVVIIFGFFVSFCTIFRLIRFLSLESITSDSWSLLFQRQVVTRFDSLMLGVLAAYFCYYYPNKWQSYRKQSMLVGLLILLISKILEHAVPSASFYHSVFSFTVTSLGIACILPYLHSVKNGSGMIYGMVTKISIISYSMYLLNLTVVYWIIIMQIPWDMLGIDTYYLSFIKFMAFWFFTIVISTLMYKHFEHPMMALRDR